MSLSAPPAVEQLSFPGQAAAPEGPVDLAPMFVMHRGFRRDLDAFAAVVPRIEVGDRARWARLGERFELFASVLHKHHHGEDIALWPLLAERGADPEVLAALEEEHDGIDPMLDAVRADLRALADGHGGTAACARLVGTTAQLRDGLGAHLAHEERDGMALVQSHLSQADWDRLDREVFSKDYSLREVPTALGWVASGLSEEGLRRIPGGSSRVFRAFARWMARRFDRREARMFGS
jgi:hemerythrin-like domain-containing protein